MEEDTIELIDYLRVVWKWKWFIIILTIACAIGAGIISFSLPKIYEVSMMIEPGVIDIDNNSKPIFLDSPSNIQSKIDSQAYNSKIYTRLNADPKKLELNFKTVQPKNSNILKISLEMEDVNKGIQSLSTLFNNLIEEYQHYCDYRKSGIDQQIAMNKLQLDISLDEKNYLKQEISIVKANNDKIIKERNMVLKKMDSSSDKLSLLIYSNIVQQNISQINHLNIRINILMSEVERIKSEIEILKIKKQSIANIKLIQPPQSSIYPIKPKKKLNVILAFVVGLFIAIFLAFFIEYIQKMKGYPKSIPTTDQRSSIENQEH